MCRSGDASEHGEIGAETAVRIAAELAEARLHMVRWARFMPYFAWRWLNRNRLRVVQEQFDKLALYTLHHPVIVPVAQCINGRLRANSLRFHGRLIRNLQILRDSIELALGSRYLETARNRMQMVLQYHDEILREQAYLVSPEVLDEIKRVVQETEQAFAESQWSSSGRRLPTPRIGPEQKF